MNEYKMTEKDKQYYLGCGYLEKDLPQIEEAMNVTTYEDDKGKPLSREDVLKRMKREKWLSGIGRSAFHWSAARETKRGKVILFDASALFE